MTATINTGGYSLVGKVGSDIVTLNASGAVANFSDSNTELGKTVTISGLSLASGGAVNYTLTQPITTTANIDQATSTTVVTCPANQEYTGAAITPCSVVVTGAGGLSLNPTPDYTDNTNVGTATASYNYLGDLNHASSSDSKTFTIADTTAPTIPGQIGWSTENPPAGSDYTSGTDFDNYKTCGQSLNYSPMTNLWGPSTDASGVAGYEREVYSPDASTLIYSSSLSTNYVNGGGAADGSTYWVRVRAYDAAGNKSVWTDKCAITYDNTAPIVDLVFPTPGPSATSFQAVFSEDVNATDATNPANYFLNNWPGAGGSGNLSGQATVLYDSTSHTATVTFTTPGWYVSPEQQWGVQNIHDLAGNLQSVNPYAEYSTPMVVPVTTDNIADSNWHNSSVTVNLSCTDNIGGSGCKTTYYTTNGTDPSTISPSGNSFTLSSDGTYTIKYFSKDNAGNSEAIKTATNQVKIDQTNPNGSITSPANGSIVKGTITITADANDIPSGISKVEFYHSSPVPGEKIGEATSAPYSTTWDTTTVSDRSHSIWAVVHDNSGNSIITFSVSVTVDNNPPVIDAHSDVIAEATSSAGADVTITPPMSHDAVDGDIPSTCDYSTGTFPLGDTLVTCSKTDVAGNGPTYVTFTVNVVDTTAPVITLLGDDPQTVERKDAYIEAGANVTDNYDTGLTASINSSTVNVDVTGTYYVTYDAVDSNGNVATQVIRTVKVVDTTDPDNVNNFRAVYHPVLDNVKLTWHADDDDIYRVYIYRGGSKNFTVDSNSRITINHRNDEGYTDNDITRGETYYYKVVTIDESDNKSNVKVIKIVIPTIKIPAVSTNQGTEVLPAGAVLGAESSNNENNNGGQVLGSESQNGNSNGTQTGAGSSGQNWWYELLALIAIILVGGWFWIKRKQD